jgi:signal transduction histidine kinase/CheY-like chemotaxis protein
VTSSAPIGVCLALTRALTQTRTVEDVYRSALDALADGFGVSRSAVLTFDAGGIMRFNAWRGISPTYRAAVDGHSPWAADARDPAVIVVADVHEEPTLAVFGPIFDAEGIAALAFIPLVSLGRVSGKFMLYYDTPYALTPDEVQLAGVIASQVAFALERTRAEKLARHNEERLRFALEAAAMTTWEWELTHGFPSDTSNFDSFVREIHPDDRASVYTSIQRAIADGVPHDAEYRIVAHDGSVQWIEGKGRVEYEDSRPVRMTGVSMIATRRKEAELARLATAEEASRLKEEFLATLSHELRTPLNAILGWVQMLQEGRMPPERMRQAIEVIGRNTLLQAQLIEDILDVSRIITGKLEIERHPVLVPPLIDTVVTGALPAAQSKNIELVKIVPSDIPPIEGDPKRLHQVLGNLLSNAVKFTPQGGRVEVRCTAEGESIAIDVQDSGIGIAPEFLPYVFDRFRQADSRSTRRHGGLGLGLAIARHLVEQHRGEIHASSDGPGHGTTVHVRLPVRTCAARVALSSDEASPRNVELQLHGMTIVVVDDQPDSCELLATLFEQYGAQVVQCNGAVPALEALRGRQVHLLLADIAMPDVDGYELIRRVRTAHAGVPAIAVSAYARPQDRRRALAAGYDGYCAKPVEATQLLQAVRDVMLAS